MVRMRSTHHLHKHRKNAKKSSKFDIFVTCLSGVYPLTGVPQAIGVWHGGSTTATGITWLCFLLFGFIFLAYGIIHKVWPMIIDNVLWTFIDIAVVVGAFTH